jgi:hypothetical protein
LRNVLAQPHPDFSKIVVIIFGIVVFVLPKNITFENYKVRLLWQKVQGKRLIYPRRSRLLKQTAEAEGICDDTRKRDKRRRRHQAKLFCQDGIHRN